MNRRQFVKISGLGTASLLLTRNLFSDEFSEMKKRVGLIGCGWYGKTDLWRLVQVAPVEIVSLCDVDKRMLEDAGEMAASRQLSKKKPRLYTDYREMLKEKDLDIVLVASPDHWHSLQMIEAAKSGADVWVQKPTSVDVIESLSMIAAARKYKRVVQVGTQRRSTPHLMDALNKVIKEKRLGKIAYVDICCYWHMRAKGNPPDIDPPEYLDYETWTGPAPKRPFCKWTHPRGWRAFMEYGNGIVGDMCIHMFDMVRWMLELGWPKRISSFGGILVDKESKANITDTQTAAFDYDNLKIIWTHRTWGESVDPKYPWSATFYGDKGTLKASVFSYDFTPLGNGEKLHGEALYEYDKYPEDKTEKDLERHCAAAIRGHMRDFLRAIANRSKPVADIEQGCISSISCILANLSMQVGRTLEWDPVNNRVVNDEEANKLLKRQYRAPWIHPEPNTV